MAKPRSESEALHGFVSKKGRFIASSAPLAFDVFPDLGIVSECREGHERIIEQGHGKHEHADALDDIERPPWDEERASHSLLVHGYPRLLESGDGDDHRDGHGGGPQDSGDQVAGDDGELADQQAHVDVLLHGLSVGIGADDRAEHQKLCDLIGAGNGLCENLAHKHVRTVEQHDGDGAYEADEREFRNEIFDLFTDFQ